MGKKKNRKSENKKTSDSASKKFKQKITENKSDSIERDNHSERTSKKVEELPIEHNWELFSTSLKLLSSFKLQNDDNEEENEEMKNKKLEFLKTVKKLSLPKKKPPPKLKIAKTIEDPPSDFRTIPIIPTEMDLKRNDPFIRRNIVEGRYDDVYHYLDIQFRLFREDYISPIREGIEDYHKELKEMNCIYSHKFRTVFVYENVKIQNPFLDDNNGLVFSLQFPKFPDNFKWDKRLQEGSLLCLSSDHFKDNFIFAVVADRDKVLEGQITVKFEKNIDFVYENPTANYMMLEPFGGYFESYRYSLNVLKELTDDNFPLKDYIIVHRKKVKPPSYLNKNSTYNFRCLFENNYFKSQIRSRNETDKLEIDFKSTDCKSFKEPIEKKDGWLSSDEELELDCERKNGWPSLDNLSSSDKVVSTDAISENSVFFEKVPILKYSKWPTKELLKLDSAQYEVLKAALTRELTIIQGPPGTGKTFIGLKIVKLLLANKELWYPEKSDQEYPILIVCYTNHALDQFLERILEFTEDIVRIGSQGESTILEKYRLSNLRLTESYCFPKSEEKQHLTKRKVQLKNQVNVCYLIIEAASRLIFPLSVLKQFMEDKHYDSLRINCKNDGIRSGLEEWLNVSYDENIQNTYCRDVLVTQDFGLDEELCSWIPPTEMSQLISESSWNESNRLNKHEEYIMKNMKNSRDSDNFDEEDMRIMTETEANLCKPAYELELKDRWRLYRLWVVKFINFVKEQMQNYQNAFSKTVTRLKNLNLERDIAILQNKLVVGMTCTGAAKFHDLIEAVAPQIVIIEEAAEVLETHLITSLTKSIKHLIMIGDHQQLQPLPTVHELAEKCEMKISLFERMVRNDIDCYTLNSQHRMRRSIAQLLVPHIYKELFSDSSVDKYEDIKGIEKNMFFINHSHMEKEFSVSSYCNEFEAKFLVQLSKYLIFQGYNCNQITILATYAGQVKTIEKELSKVSEECAEKNSQICLREIKVTSVDNYQGEENDIILISFVRSNYENNIGFLSRSNRVCVALSRAKKGLYCIGNFDLLASVSELWKQIVDDLKDQNAIDLALNLICQKHNVTTSVQLIKDFKHVSDGGCEEICDNMLECGHRCKRHCHITDMNHKSYKCDEKCTKKCKFNHPCKKKCHEECGECKVFRFEKLPCGHCYPVPCHIENPGDFKCKKICEKMLKCGHVCDKKCSDECEPCLRMVPKTYSDCKHTVRKPCSINIDEIRCSEPCPHFLRCGHPCPKKCSDRPCPEICERFIVVHLSCNHVKEQKCSEQKNEYCNAPCCVKLSCGHNCTGNCTICKVAHKKCVAICGKRLFNGMTCKLICRHKGECNANIEYKKQRNKKTDTKAYSSKDSHRVNKWKTDYVNE